MNKRNLKLFAVPAIYVIAILVFGGSMYLISTFINNSKLKGTEEMEFVDKEIVTDNEYIPVVNVTPTLLRPFLNEGVSINKSFYNQDDEKTNQENSIVVYENTYMQNTGVDYKYNEIFDVVSILDGTVIEVTENDILGKTIKIRHNNDIISTYQCLSEINKNKDDTVLRGEVIGKAGTSSLYSKDFNLHFELSYLGKFIDPEKSYNKTIDEL